MLPEAFAHDADRLARFTREAKTLAALNHPNIAHIHGLEESSGVTALVMELVEGDDLSQRIARAAIPIDDVLPIAKQIAEALEAALPSRTPARLRALIARCLVKDPRQRLRDIGEARVVLQRPDDPAGAVGQAKRAVVRAVPWAVAAIAVLAAGWALLGRPARAMPPATWSPPTSW